MPNPDQLRILREQIAPAAIKASRLTGVPAECICSQCILESGWMAHVNGNNCFGIKDYRGAFDRQLLPTQEWFTDAEVAYFLAAGDGRTASLFEPLQQNAQGRKRYHVQDWFAAFPTLADCFTRHALLFTEGRYAPYLKAYREGGDLDAFVRGIGPIYATDPNYSASVLAIAKSTAVAEALKAVSA